MSERKMQPSPWPLREVLMEKSVLTQERNHKLNVPQTPVSPAAFSWAIRAPGFNSQHSFQRQTGAKLWHQGRIFQARCSQNCDHQESCLELLGQDYSTLTQDITQLNSLCFILLAVPKYNVRNSHSPALGTADFWGLFDLKFFVLQVYKHRACAECSTRDGVISLQKAFLSLYVGYQSRVSGFVLPFEIAWEIMAGSGCECEDESQLFCPVWYSSYQ